MHILKSEDTHQICKALNVLGSLAIEWGITQYLYKAKIVSVIKSLLQKNDPAITREASFLST